MKKTKILVVDDDALYRILIDDILTREGHKVTLASEGNEGQRLIGRMKFDILVTDILMPNKEGLELIQDIRGTQSNLKILAISGSGHVGHSSFLQMAEAFGADETLRKPFTPEELLDKIAVLCSGTG